MIQESFAERVKLMVSRYEKMFAGRGDVTPTDPLKFHLYHLARYWSRLVGFCRLDASDLAGLVESDLGVCVQVGSEFAEKLISADSPVFELWKDYWIQTQAVLHKRPVRIEQVEAASRAFDACVAGMNYNPWS